MICLSAGAMGVGSVVLYLSAGTVLLLGFLLYCPVHKDIDEPVKMRCICAILKIGKFVVSGAVSSNPVQTLKLRSVKSIGDIRFSHSAICVQKPYVVLVPGPFMWSTPEYGGGVMQIERAHDLALVQSHVDGHVQFPPSSLGHVQGDVSTLFGRDHLVTQRRMTDFIADVMQEPPLEGVTVSNVIVCVCVCVCVCVWND